MLLSSNATSLILPPLPMTPTVGSNPKDWMPALVYSTRISPQFTKPTLANPTLPFPTVSTTLMILLVPSVKMIST